MHPLIWWVSNIVNHISMINQWWQLQSRLDCVKTFSSLHSLSQICPLKNNLLHEPNNILLLYIKNNVVQCIGADATKIHVYAHTDTPTHNIYIYTYIHKHTYIHTYTCTCALVQANFLNRHYIYKYDMEILKGLLT